MDWIKVKVRHAEYDMAACPDKIFRTWIMIMIFVAATERKPSRDQLIARHPEADIFDLEIWLKSTGTTLERVIGKVLEDVEATEYRRKHNREYMYIKKHGSNSPYVGRPSDDQRMVKRREDRSMTNCKTIKTDHDKDKDKTDQDKDNDHDRAESLIAGALENPDLSKELAKVGIIKKVV